MIEKVKPGIHVIAQEIIDKEFGKHEKRIVEQYWSKEWYITSAGKKTFGKSECYFLLSKPSDYIGEALNLSQEIIVIISPYSSFEPRTLDAFDLIGQTITDQRYEKMCYALISADESIEEKLRSCLTNQEIQIIVPFSYRSFDINRGDTNYIRNVFRDYFYSRDLFDYSEPLKRDTFFFGRTNIVTTVIEKHLAGSNYGLFGLRKTGKTSIIYDVCRKAEFQGFIPVVIDCQNTSFNMRRWNNALYFVLESIRDKIKYEELEEEQFTEAEAGRLFNQHINKMATKESKTILLMFDEIENITFEKSSVQHWRENLDFVYFWQSIRSAYQSLQNQGTFTFAIFGTNAKCIEQPSIQGVDNPIFNIFQPYYIPGFDHDQTREMTRKLGRIMGIKFEEEIYTHLVEDYGGHPFLMRRVCSKIAQLNKKRPVVIDRQKYNTAKKQFNLENLYFEMILDVLKQFYQDEYEMLTFLAANDIASFMFFVNEDPSIVSHLLGYGIIGESDGSYDFKIDAIKEYLQRKAGSHLNFQSDDEKWSHLCVQRNELETQLRRMVRIIIRNIHKSEAEAHDYILKKIYANEPKYRAKKYSELFDSRIGQIYLKNLTDIINSKWEYFADYFGKQEIFNAFMNVLNAEGRFDAHATPPTVDEINAVDHAAQYLHRAITKFNESIQ